MIMGSEPHFFKIILDSTIREGKFRIPGEFLRKCREGLSSPVVLKVPGGAIWHVELLVCGHEVWLGNGWRELAGYYFLAFGHLILFKHQGDSIFHLFIFDKSATEIKYPCGSICAGKPKLQDPKTEENDDDLPSGKKRGEKSPFLLSLKWTRTDSAMNEGKSMPVMCKKSDFRLTTLTRPSSCSGTNGALQAANNFTSEYPSFKLVVRSYHWKHCNVTIPCRFFRRYIEHKAENAILQVADRVWPVQFKPAPRCHSVALSVGWRAFATANSLEAGDVCIFELIKSKVLKVSIFKGVYCNSVSVLPVCSSHRL
ncbi:B3 domain-containing transcription factor VRN1-like [Hevea brasiliensis]|uniref:B3 domain-containing transcription factor VRN1-like n=1 Tax=Hevea brasiliensis TaxID=3981 RepID=UPI0025F25FA0|nr:B3 domain-containing transcription factor VRN1-like [Hevea brasiliensis]